MRKLFTPLLLIFLSVAFASTAQVTIQVGNSTNVTPNTSASPVNNYWKNYHMQMLYLKSEFMAQGINCPQTLDEIAFNVISLPNTAMPNYTIKIAHYSGNTLNTSFAGPFMF